MRLQWIILFVLVVLVAWSGLEVVKSKHQSRKLFQQLVSSEKAYDELQIEWGQLLLEQHTKATHQQIENIASVKLDMKVPAAHETNIVELSE